MRVWGVLREGHRRAERERHVEVRDDVVGRLHVLVPQLDPQHRRLGVLGRQRELQPLALPDGVGLVLLVPRVRRLLLGEVVARRKQVEQHEARVPARGGGTPL